MYKLAPTATSPPAPGFAPGEHAKLVDVAMRVLQIHNAYGLPGGEDTIVETEAALLASNGHAVERFGTKNPTSGVAAVASLARAPRNCVAVDALADTIRSFKPQVAHVHNTWFSLSPEVFHRLDSLGIPAVMTLQNYRLLCANGQLFRDGRVCTDCVGQHPWRGVAHRCYRSSFGQSAVAAATISLGRIRGTFDLVDRFLAPSQFVKEQFVASGFDGKRIVVRPNVIDDPGPRTTPPSDSMTLLYAGRLSAEKGLPSLIGGWRRSGLARRGFTLKVVGDGPLRCSLMESAVAGVHFAGWQTLDKVRRDMGNARALVFPSEWYENFGRVIIEAMAAGLPILASDIATPAEIVGPLGAEWLVTRGDELAWGRSLARLADPDRVDAAGIQARRLYEENYTTEEGLRTLLAVYRDVVGVAVD